MDRDPQLRERLVAALVAKGAIRSQRVAEAFRTVPRHLFLPGVPPELAYRNEAIPIKADGSRILSSSSEPETMATMLEQLELRPGHRVLEVGAGSGYNAALMAHLVEHGSVTTLDIEPDLVAAARAHLRQANVTGVTVVCSDGVLGHPPGAPYDRIIATVGVWDITPAFWDQLAPNGRLLLPMSIGSVQQSIAMERSGDHLESVSIRDTGFMRLRGVHAGPERKLDVLPDIGVRLYLYDERPVDAVGAARALSAPPKISMTGWHATLEEVFSSLGLWLAVNEPDLCHLVAFADPKRVASGPVPCMMEWRNEPWRERVTPALVNGDGSIAALARLPGQPLELDDQTRFKLCVQGFGESASLVARLTNHLAAWDRAGRPSTEGLRCRAYRTGNVQSRRPEELVLTKLHSQLLLSGPLVKVPAVE